MPTSLLLQLLREARNFTDADFDRLDPAIKRLLISELYEMLYRDNRIMPLLVEAIEQHKNPQGSALMQQLFDELCTRIGEDYDTIMRR